LTPYVLVKGELDKTYSYNVFPADGSFMQYTIFNFAVGPVPASVTVRGCRFRAPAACLYALTDYWLLRTVVAGVLSDTILPSPL
jgi:hypothetical protein